MSRLLHAALHLPILLHLLHLRLFRRYAQYPPSSLFSEQCSLCKLFFGFIDTVFKDLATRTNSRKMYSPHLYKIPPASCPNSPQSGQSSEASFKLSMSRTSHLEAWVLRRWQCCREVKLASQYQSKAAGKCKNTALLMISSARNNILCSITCQECKYVNSNHGLLKNCREDIRWCFLMVVS